MFYLEVYGRLQGKGKKCWLPKAGLLLSPVIPLDYLRWTQLTLSLKPNEVLALRAASTFCARFAWATRSLFKWLRIDILYRSKSLGPELDAFALIRFEERVLFANRRSLWNWRWQIPCICVHSDAALSNFDYFDNNPRLYIKEIDKSLRTYACLSFEAWPDVLSVKSTSVGSEYWTIHPKRLLK